MLVIFAIAIGLVSLLVSFVISPKYKAHTSIIIAEGPSTKSLSGFSMRAFSAAGLSLPTESTASYTEILQSRRIFNEVVNESNLRKHYGFPDDGTKDLKMFRKMSEKLGVSPIRDNVLHLSFEDRDPKKAAEVANLFIVNLREYLDQSMLTTTENARKFIEDQITQVNVELEESEEELKVFMAENEATGLDEQVIQAVRQVSNIDAERNTAKIALDLVRQNIEREKNRKDDFGDKFVDISEEYTQYSEQWRKPGNLLSMPSSRVSYMSDLPDEFLKDSAVTALRSKLTELKIKLLEEKITKTEKHPSVVKINDEIFKIKGLFLKEIEDVLDSRLASLEFERVNLEAEIAAYDSVLGEFEKSWVSLPEKSMKYARLKRNVEALSQVFLMLKNQLAETRIDVAREKKYFEVLDEAIPPDRPDRPKPLMNMAIGLLLGLVIGFAWVYFSALFELRERRDVA